MLKDLLESKKCFKLVCGAGNEDIKEVERLVYTYAKAGCRFFDLSANIDVINSAKKGYKLADIKEEPYFCISFGIKGDPHVCKVSINDKNCKQCGVCEMECPQNAIKDYKVTKESCIGCLKCLQECAFNAIELNYEDITPSAILNSTDLTKIACVELHASSCDEEDLIKKWTDISNSYKGLLSICIDRSNLGNNQLLSRIKRMIGDRIPYSTIIQADGIPMSGASDDFKTTLQSVAIAEIIQNSQIPAYLILSGGTNSKTTELAKMCSISSNGVAIGSYARRIVKQFINEEDYYQNSEVQKTAILAAKELIETSLKYLG